MILNNMQSWLRRSTVTTSCQGWSQEPKADKQLLDGEVEWKPHWYSSRSNKNPQKKQVFGSKKSSKNDKWINKNPRFFKIQQKILQKITSRSQPLLRWWSSISSRLEVMVVVAFQCGDLVPRRLMLSPKVTRGELDFSISKTLVYARSSVDISRLLDWVINKYIHIWVNYKAKL